MLLQKQHTTDLQLNHHNISDFDLYPKKTQLRFTSAQSSPKINQFTKIDHQKLTLDCPQNQQESQKNLKQKPRKRRYNKKGHWSLEQNSKYYLFMRSHLRHFRSSHLRRLQKIFKQMSNYLGTRSANQCRSHHQKHQKKYLGLGVLMSSLYQMTKEHPLLLNQPPFSRMDLRNRSLLTGCIGKEDENFENQQSGKTCSLIVYEMPESQKIITYDQYMSLISAK